MYAIVIEPIIPINITSGDVHYTDWFPLTTSKKMTDAKEITHCKWLIVVTELFNIAVKSFDANKSAGCSKLFVVIELLVSELGAIP